jgi:hypothetical protein
MLENGLFLEVMLDNDKREISNNLEDILKFIPAISSFYEVTADKKEKENKLTTHNLMIAMNDYGRYFSIFELIKEKEKLLFRLYIINNGRLKKIDEFGNASVDAINIFHGDGYDRLEMRISYTNILMKTFGKDKVTDTYHENFKRKSDNKE